MGNLLVTPDVYISGSYLVSSAELSPISAVQEVTAAVSGGLNIAAIISKDAASSDYHEGEVLTPRPTTSTVVIDLPEIVQRHSSSDKLVDNFLSLVTTSRTNTPKPGVWEVSNVSTGQDRYTTIIGQSTGGGYTYSSAKNYPVYPDYVTKGLYKEFDNAKQNYWLGTPWKSRSLGPYEPAPPSTRILYYRTFIPGQYCFWSWRPCYKSDADDHLPWIVDGTHTGYINIWTQSRINHTGVYTGHHTSFMSKDSGLVDPQGIEVWDFLLERCDNGTDLVFYYINDWGGLDWFNPQVKAKEIKTDNIERSTYRPTRATTKVYQQKRTRNWRIKSGMLTDQADLTRCQELLKARKVWMHMPSQNYMVEVIVQGNSVEYKTFQNQGRRWPSYEFTVQEVKEISLR